MAMDRSSIILVYKPAVYPAEYTQCKTARDLRHLVETTTNDPKLFDPSSGLEYVASVEAAGDETSVSLSGDRYNPEESLPCLDNVTFLDLCGSPKREYEMNWRNTVHELKEKIRRATGIALDSQLLDFQGNELEDADRLYENHILENAVIQCSIKSYITYIDAPDDNTLFMEGICQDRVLEVKIKCGIEFKFNHTTTTISSLSKELLIHVHQHFADKAGHDLCDLVFGFSNTSGQTSHVSKSWLSDRAEIFKAKSVLGAVGENGVRDGDSIYVLKMVSKRKRNDDEDDSGNGARKRQETGIGDTQGSGSDQIKAWGPPRRNAHS